MHERIESIKEKSLSLKALMESIDNLDGQLTFSSSSDAADNIDRIERLFAIALDLTNQISDNLSSLEMDARDLD